MPTTYLFDTFTGADGTSFGGASWNGFSGQQSIQGNRGAVGTNPDYEPAVFDGKVTSSGAQIPANFALTCDLVLGDALLDWSPEYRLQGGGAYYKLFIKPSSQYLVAYPAGTTYSVSPSLTIAASDTIHLKLVVDGSSHRVRLWLNSASEPTTWAIDATNSAQLSNTGLRFVLENTFTDADLTGYIDNVLIESTGVTPINRTASGTGAGTATAARTVSRIRTASGTGAGTATATSATPVVNAQPSTGGMLSRHVMRAMPMPPSDDIENDWALIVALLEL